MTCYYVILEKMMLCGGPVQLHTHISFVVLVGYTYKQCLQQPEAMWRLLHIVITNHAMMEYAYMHD